MERFQTAMHHQYSNGGDPPKDHNSRPSSNGTGKQVEHNGKVQVVCADVKPRLTKEQHDILEAHFQQHNKPSTATKKGFAEALGVSLEKVNNWFQNRRAKVKQDAKKALNQRNVLLHNLPYHNPHFQMSHDNLVHHNSLPQYYQPNASLSQPCLPSVPDHSSTFHQPPALLNTQMPPQEFDGLGCIPETTHAGSYDGIVQSLIGAGYSLPSNGASMMSHDPYISLDGFSFPQDMSGNSLHDFTSTGPSVPLSSTEDWQTLDAGLEQQPFQLCISTSGDGPEEDSKHAYSEPQSTTTPQSTNTNATSVASQYSGWQGDKPATTNISPNFSREEEAEPTLSAPCKAESSNEHMHWIPPQQDIVQTSFPPQSLYQHRNLSSQSTQSCPSDHDLTQGNHLSAPSFDQPFNLSDDVFRRRNSSCSAVNDQITNLSLQSRSSDSEFVKPSQPSGLAARRQKRPAALNSTAIRSASYSAGVPSPNNVQGVSNSDVGLRRIRSTGIPSRVQKSVPGPAQRSPLHFSFAEALDSPKFQRHASGITSTVTSPGLPVSTGSLAPPTPLTPNQPGQMSHFPPWQKPGNFNKMQSYSNAEGLGVSYSIDPASAGMPINVASPPSTPHEANQLLQSQSRFSNQVMYRDTPPQSAPATQINFPRTAMAPPAHSMAEMHPSHEYPAAMGKPTHLRRPSLPSASNGMSMAPQVSLPVSVATGSEALTLDFAMQYDQAMMDGYMKQNVSQAPQDMSFPLSSGPVQAPSSLNDLYIHQYDPPNLTNQSSSPPRPQETQPKSFIFANQTPNDFH